MPPEITQLTGIGIGGLAVLLFYKLAATHIDSNTEAIKDLSETIRIIKELLKNKL